MFWIIPWPLLCWNKKYGQNKTIASIDFNSDRKSLIGTNTSDWMNLLKKLVFWKWSEIIWNCSKSTKFLRLSLLFERKWIFDSISLPSTKKASILLKINLLCTLNFEWISKLQRHHCGNHINVERHYSAWSTKAGGEFYIGSAKRFLFLVCLRVVTIETGGKHEIHRSRYECMNEWMKGKRNSNEIAVNVRVTGPCALRTHTHAERRHIHLRAVLHLITYIDTHTNRQIHAGYCARDRLLMLLSR